MISPRSSTSAYDVAPGYSCFWSDSNECFVQAFTPSPSGNILERADIVFAGHDSRTPPDEPSFTVNTTDDAVDAAGCTTLHCSLREAISRSNAASDVDTITFNIPGAGPHSIRPASDLPAIVAPVLIDATTEPDFVSCSSGPVVEIDGSLLGDGAIGFWLAATSTLRGFAINRLAVGGTAVYVTGQSGSTVECSRIGTDVTGTADLGNYIGVHAAVAATIGGSAPGTGNVISGNEVGIYLSGTGVSVQGNFIGTDASGMLDLGNAFDGIFVDNGSGNTIGGTAAGAGNVISGNGNSGVGFEVPITRSSGT